MWIHTKSCWPFPFIRRFLCPLVLYNLTNEKIITLMNLLHTVLVSFNLRIQCRSATDLPRPVPQLPDQALLHVRPSGHPTPSSSSLRSTPTCTPLHGKHLQPDQVSFVRQHLSILSFSLLLLTRCLLGVWDDVGSCNATPFGGLCYCTTCCLPRVWATSTGSIDRSKPCSILSCFKLSSCAFFG